MYRETVGAGRGVRNRSYRTMGRKRAKGTETGEEDKRKGLQVLR